MEFENSNSSRMIEELTKIKIKLNFSNVSPSRRRYPQRFKMLSARVLEEGVSASELSRRLSVPPVSLYAWLKQYKKDIKPINIISKNSDNAQSVSNIEDKVEIRIGEKITMQVAFKNVDARFLKSLNEAFK